MGTTTMRSNLLCALFVASVASFDSARLSETAIPAAHPTKNDNAVAKLDAINSLATSFVKRVIKGASGSELLAVTKEYCDKGAVGTKVGALPKYKAAEPDSAAGTKPVGCCLPDLGMNVTAATASEASADQIKECKKIPKDGDACTADLNSCNGKRCVDKYNDCGLGLTPKVCIPDGVDPENDAQPDAAKMLVAGKCRTYTSSGFNGSCVDKYDCLWTGSHNIPNKYGECKNGRCSVDNRMAKGTACGTDSDPVKIKQWNVETELSATVTGQVLNCGSGLTCQADSDGKHSCQPVKDIGAECTVTSSGDNCISHLVCDAKQEAGEKGKCAVPGLKKPGDLTDNLAMCDYRGAAITDGKCPSYPYTADETAWSAAQLTFKADTVCDQSQATLSTNEDNVCGFHACACDITKGEYNCKQNMITNCIITSDTEVLVAKAKCLTMFPQGDGRLGVKVPTINQTINTMCQHLWEYRPFIAPGMNHGDEDEKVCSAETGMGKKLKMNGVQRYTWAIGNYSSATPTCGGKWYSGVNYPRENVANKPSKFDDVWNGDPEITGVNNKMYQTVDFTLADQFKTIGPLHNESLALAIGQQLAMGLNMDGSSQPTAEGTWFDFYKDKDGNYDLIVKQSNQIQCYNLADDAVVTCKILALNGESGYFNSVDNLGSALGKAIDNAPSPIHSGFPPIGYIQPNSMTFPSGTGMLPMMVLCVIIFCVFIIILVVVICCVCKGKKKDTVN